MSNDKTYNGWTNWETWNVKLWIDNEQASYNAAVELAKAAIEEALESQAASPAARAWYMLSNTLQDWVPEAFDFPTEGPAADLCGRSLSRVDWLQISRSILEDMDEYAALAEDESEEA